MVYGEGNLLALFLIRDTSGLVGIRNISNLYILSRMVKILKVGRNVHMHHPGDYRSLLYVHSETGVIIHNSWSGYRGGSEGFMMRGSKAIYDMIQRSEHQTDSKCAETYLSSCSFTWEDPTTFPGFLDSKSRVKS